MRSKLLIVAFLHLTFVLSAQRNLQFLQLEKVGSIEKYKRPLQIAWNRELTFIPAQECEALLRGD